MVMAIGAVRHPGTANWTPCHDRGSARHIERFPASLTRAANVVAGKRRSPSRFAPRARPNWRHVGVVKQGAAAGFAPLYQAAIEGIHLTAIHAAEPANDGQIGGVRAAIASAQSGNHLTQCGQGRDALDGLRDPRPRGGRTGPIVAVAMSPLLRPGHS
jgi:hypothetical protein